MNTEELVRWGSAAAWVAGGWALGWAVRRFVLRWIARLVHRTPTDLDEMLLATLRPHVPLWFVFGGIAAAVRTAAPSWAYTPAVDKLLVAAFTLSLTLAISAFFARVIAARAARTPGGLPATTLSQNLVRAVVVALGLMVILGNLGVAITPLLTALGVSSLAVALALQPTLTNLFAGFHISLARMIRPGDYIELESGQQGYIEDIGWRSTQLRELPNNLIIIPNARLAEIIVKNYSLPVPEQAALVQVGVSYKSDLEHVQRVTGEVAREIQRTVPGAVPEFEPFIRLHTFGDSSINFTVILRVQQYVDRHVVTHEFVKRLHRRYAETGIEIPFPQRVIHQAGAA